MTRVKPAVNDRFKRVNFLREHRGAELWVTEDYDDEVKLKGYIVRWPDGKEEPFDWSPMMSVPPHEFAAIVDRRLELPIDG